jgi:hypothetical protein
MIDNKLRTDLEALVTAFLEGGGTRGVVVNNLSDLADDMWQEDINRGAVYYPESDAEADEWDEED